ncbi:beta-N-acetylhexosaminidase [Ancylomarina sp. 16SWW S1-10-2]|uniref:beta-N-acetylhexosaminidase n=1 Tax=Ancylomarina sp. 16SWW S1-10-2 TaxID=2499681 RepID=UPI0012AE31CE|nr:beta-N-acetylhexosaminidase [Ancylomarina sp. 16SWW S1-10-2]MRT92572.1 beta-N-acetylhexosaminidase [Ancylomarina sp. 16SWW S1-10-2]
MNFSQVLLLTIALVSCKTPTPKDLLKENLIPKPTKLVATGSSFDWTARTKIYLSAEQEGVKAIADYLADFVAPATGFQTEVRTTNKPVSKRGIALFLNKDSTAWGDEGYHLNITEKRVVLEAYQLAGLFRGIQTIRQLLPARIESKELQNGPWELASGTIEDTPNYEYRGAMLDVARHFFDVSDVKRYIDLLAAYKMNILHLHLADDQGWRIEIKSWPNLTKYGGSTQVGGGKGGFFTQAQYIDIVKYAQECFITVIPEIDMPGHTNAALASYAELNANGKSPSLYTGTRVGFSTLATDKEITYKFIDDVIRELAAITPGEYIHIGGDESHATKKKDYIKFINRVQKIVHAHGKKMIGWADISAAKLKENTLAQFWHLKSKTALDAVKQNVKIIMSPAPRAYMDMQYDSICPLGLHWAGYIELDKAYDWSLETFVDGISKENIVGIEAPLWTETVETIDDIEYLVFPRLLGYAELGWSSQADKSWDEYKVRLGMQKTRFEYMGINYYSSPLVPWEEEVVMQKVE